MKRKPTFTQHIGSIHSASHPDDLIPNLASELAYLLNHCRVDHETRKAHMRVLKEARGELPDGETAGHTLEYLVDALETFAPPYTYFGEEGDGDYGFWPSVNGHWDDCELPRLEAGDEKGHAEFWGEDVLLVNDHGNIECGRFDLRGRFHSYWSAV